MNRPTIYRGPDDRKCPTCDHTLSAATSTRPDSEERGPEDGDPTICFHCSEVLQFKGDGFELLDIHTLPRELQDQLYDAIEYIKSTRTYQ